MNCRTQFVVNFFLPKLWGKVKRQLLHMGESPESYEHKLIEDYLDSAGGIYELDPGDMRRRLILVDELGLWRVCSCSQNPKKTHQSASCKRDVAVFTEKGLEVGKELINNKLREVKMALKEKIEMTPPRILSFIIETLENVSEHQIVQGIPDGLIASEKRLLDEDLYPFIWLVDHDTMRDKSGLFFPIDDWLQSFSSGLAELNLIKLNPSNHINDGWRSLNGIRTCSEVIQKLQSGIRRVRVKNLKTEFVRENKVNIAKMLTLHMLEDKKVIRAEDINRIRVQFSVQRKIIEGYLEDLCSQGYIELAPTSQNPYALKRNISEIKRQLYNEIKEKNNRWWSAERTVRSVRKQGKKEPVDNPPELDKKQTAGAIQPPLQDTQIPQVSLKPTQVPMPIPSQRWIPSREEMSGIQKRLVESFPRTPRQKVVDETFLLKLEKRIPQVLLEFDIKCEANRKDFDIGPRIVRANVTLGKGVTIDKVKRRSEDIANKLFSDKELFDLEKMGIKDEEIPTDIQIESVPAKGMVGISLPRNDFEKIGIRSVLEEATGESNLSFPVGLSLAGESKCADLESMPHLLVAGTPGSGKSTFLNSMIIGLAFRNSPDSLQFVLVDMKGGLEFGAYGSLPHTYKNRIVQSVKETLKILSDIAKEMERRYSLWKQKNVKKLSEYNDLDGVKKLPYYVVIIDEFAELAKNRDVIEIIQRIAQKGRAAGIFIVVSTQRPSVKVISGDLKAVIPSRLSFRLPSLQDSKVILDEPGAEVLFGKGDMFLKETATPRRFQGYRAENDEIARFVECARECYEQRSN